MMNWLLSLFAWREHRTTAVWRYDHNTVTGKRRAVRLTMGGWSPLDRQWLQDGKGEPIVIE